MSSSHGCRLITFHQKRTLCYECPRFRNEVVWNYQPQPSWESWDRLLTQWVEGADNIMFESSMAPQVWHERISQFNKRRQPSWWNWQSMQLTKVIPASTSKLGCHCNAYSVRISCLATCVNSRESLVWLSSICPYRTRYPTSSSHNILYAFVCLSPLHLQKVDIAL